MKKLQTGLAALLLCTTIAIAQPPARQHDKKPGHHGKEMGFRQLNLSEDQQTKMKAANESFRKQLQALNSDENQTVKQLRDKRASLAKAHKAQIENLLTTEQKNKLAELKVQAKKRHEEMATKRLDKLKQDLSLTDQQVTELKKRQESAKAQMMAIHNDQSLDRTVKMQKMKALHEEMKTNLDKVLTAEQKTKWEGMRKERFQHFKMRHPHHGPEKTAPAV